MKIKLSDHFTFRRLLRFALPSMVMLVFVSIYSIVDGFFVSNFVGKTPFAAVNFIMPFTLMLGAVGFLFGTGGCALVSRKLGEDDKEGANRIFSLIVYASIAVGLIIAVVGFFVMRPVARGLGAGEEMLDDCVLYGSIMMIAIPAYVMQVEFQNFLIAAEKPKLGLIITLIAGVVNIGLDALFVVVFKWGLTGAAVATVISQFIGGCAPLIYFICKNKSLLRLTKTVFNGRALLKICTNGSSEFLSNVSMSLVGMLYNFQLLRYVGENGVAAYGVLMYVNFVFNATFLGYAIGTAPIVSFHYGAGNKAELKSLLKKSLVIVSIFSVAMLGIAEGLAIPLSKAFVGYDESLYQLTSRGFFIFSFAFLFAGFAIFGSSFFTALNDGLNSVLISFLRTCVFQVAFVFVLPIWFGVDGIWASVAAAELIAAIISAILLLCKRKKYGY